MVRYIDIQANKKFFHFLKSRCLPILNTPYFIEYKTPAKGIFLRVASTVDERYAETPVRAYIEPQLNITRSVKDGCRVFKMQISICPLYGESYGKERLFAIEKFEVKVESLEDLFRKIRMCEEYRGLVSEFILSDAYEDNVGNLITE